MESKGAKIKVSAPPGGHCSDIFGTQPDPNPSPRRLNQSYQKSSVFDETDANSNTRKQPLTPQHQPFTKNRLFGEESEVPKSPRRLTDTYRSSLFTSNGDELPRSPSKTPKKTPIRNPITGAEKLTNGQIKETNGPTEDEPITNGDHVNGVTNGHISEEEKEQITKRQPPGGFSSGVIC